MGFQLAIKQEQVSPPTRDLRLLCKERADASFNRVVISYDDQNNAVSCFNDQIWDFKAYYYLKNKNKGFPIFDFSKIGKRKLRFETKVLIYCLLHHQSTKLALRKLSTLKSYFYVLLNTANFIAKTLNLESYSALNDVENLTKYLEHCKNVKQYSVTSLKQCLVLMRTLSKLNAYLPFSFQPSIVTITKTARHYAAKTKRGINQFPVIPQQVANALYGYAYELIEMVIPHAQTIAKLQKELYDNHDIAYQACKSAGKICSRNNVRMYKLREAQDIIELHLNKTPLWPEYQRRLVKNHRNNYHKAFKTLFTDIQFACYFLCIAFSGMRDSEARGLQANSYLEKEYNAKTFHFLRSKTHKMSNNHGGTDTLWSTVPIAGKALEIASTIIRPTQKRLLKLSTTTDNAIKKQKLVDFAQELWVSIAYVSRLPTRLDLTHIIRRFSRNVDYRLTTDDVDENRHTNPLSRHSSVKCGSIWPLTLHQLRRTLAFFAIRHNLVSIPALKMQLQHMSVEMTEYYANHAAIAAYFDTNHKNNALLEFVHIVEDEKVNKKAEIANKLYNSHCTLYGAKGNEITKCRTKLPERYKSISSLKRLITDGTITLHHTGIGYCTAGYNCSMNSWDKPANCFGCGNIVYDNDSLNILQQLHADLIANYKQFDTIDKLSISFRFAALTEIRGVEKMFKVFNAKFDRFEHNDNELKEFGL